MSFFATEGGKAAVVLAGAVTLILLIMWLAARLAYRDGYEAGRLDERSIHHQRARQAPPPPPTRLLVEPARFGRHAPWEPRLTVTSAPAWTPSGPAALTGPLMHRPTDSSELRALVAGTDRYIEGMRRDGAAYRQQLAGTGPRGNSFANGASNWQGPAMAGHTDWQQAELMASQPNQFRDGQ